MSVVNYPPKEISKKPKFGKRNFEHIILWMLANNDECQWSDFTQEQLRFSTSTLSKYFNILKSRGYVDNYSRGHYKITPEGEKRFNDVSRTRGKKRRLSYPPEAISVVTCSGPKAEKLVSDPRIAFLSFTGSSEELCGSI